MTLSYTANVPHFSSWYSETFSANASTNVNWPLKFPSASLSNILLIDIHVNPAAVNHPVMQTLLHFLSQCGMVYHYGNTFDSWQQNPTGT